MVLASAKSCENAPTFDRFEKRTDCWHRDTKKLKQTEVSYHHLVWIVSPPEVAGRCRDTAFGLCYPKLVIPHRFETFRGSELLLLIRRLRCRYNL